LIVYLCSPASLICDERNAYDRIPFPILFNTQIACQIAAMQQLAAMPELLENARAIMLCKMRGAE
jgi:hypothetical protein